MPMTAARELSACCRRISYPAGMKTGQAARPSSGTRCACTLLRRWQITWLGWAGSAQPSNPPCGPFAPNRFARAVTPSLSACIWPRATSRRRCGNSPRTASSSSTSSGWSQRPGFAPWCFRPGDCEPDGSSDELASGELGERAVDTYKFVVGTRLNDAPILQHENLVRLADGGQAVGDDDPGGTQTHDGVRDLRLRPVVQGAGCLVEKQDPRLGRDCSGDEQPLGPVSYTHLRAH